MSTRPTSLLAAVVLVALTGVAALLFGALFVAVSAGAIPILDGGVRPITWLVAGASLAFGSAGVAAAFGLWQGRTWAWPVAAGVQLSGTLGAVVAIATSGPQAPTLIGTVLVLAGLVAVVAPDTRRALSV